MLVQMFSLGAVMSRLPPCGHVVPSRGRRSARFWELVTAVKKVHKDARRNRTNRIGTIETVEALKVFEVGWKGVIALVSEKW